MAEALQNARHLLTAGFAAPLVVDGLATSPVASCIFNELDFGLGSVTARSACFGRTDYTMPGTGGKPNFRMSGRVGGGVRTRRASPASGLPFRGQSIQAAE